MAWGQTRSSIRQPWQTQGPSHYSKEYDVVKIGGRGQWRVESTELEKYIERLYTETKQFIDTHPFGEEADTTEEANL